MINKPLHKVYYTNPNQSVINYIEPINQNKNGLVEFENLEEMCDTYPSLKKAYEHFMSIYILVKPDFDERNQNEQR